MSTIINALTDGVFSQEFFHNGSSSHYNLLCNCNSHSIVSQDGTVSGLGSTTPGSDQPSLQNLAPELNDASINRLKFVILGVVGSFLAVLGFLGNTMSMVVLQQRQMRSSTSYYLLSLAIYDNFVLLSMLVYFIIPSLAIKIPFMKNYLVGYSITEPIGYPLSLTAQMGSIYTCVGFTVERFIAVCRPLQVANTCTKSRTIRAIVLIFVWAVLYNIPRFFHLQAVYFYEDSATAGHAVEALQTTASSLSTGVGSHSTVTSLVSHNASSPFHLMPFHFVPSGFPCSQDSESAMVDSITSFSLPSPCFPSREVNSTSHVMESSYGNAPSIASAVDTISYHNGLDVKNPLLPFDTGDSAMPYPASSPSPSLSVASHLSSSSPSSLLLSTSSQSTLLKKILTGGVPTQRSPLSLTPSVLDSQATATTAQTSKNPQVKIVRALATSFGSNPLFRNIYLIYSQLFFMFLLPFLIILFMNIGLIRAVKRSKSMQQQMVTSASARKEHNLTVMLIAVIVVFLVCQFPTIIDNMLIAVLGPPKLYPNYQYQCFYTACTLMVLVNSASNFLLYCFFGKKFRVVFLSLLGLKKRQQYVAYRSTMYRSRSNGSRVCDVEVSVL